MTENSQIRCVLVEDDPIIGAAIEQILNSSSEVNLLGSFAGEDQAVVGIDNL